MTITSNKKPLGIYVHIPFCLQRCPYCGFYSNAVLREGAPEETREYFGLLVKELEFRAEPIKDLYYVDSIYFGGGTPSLADPSLISGLLSEVSGMFTVTDGCEISMESNPGTLDGNSLKGYREAGVNRLSIGAQSFDDGILRKLGRIHDSSDIEAAFSLARGAGFDNISMDLMFSVPGMGMDEWARSLESMLGLGPEHVSFYGLQIEDGTKYYDMLTAGEIKETGDEEDREMYRHAVGILKDNGYRHYEISNAALPGFECRHNMKYWTFEDYLGIGASSSSFMGGVRTTNKAGGHGEAVAALSEMPCGTDPAPGVDNGDGAPGLTQLFSERHVNSERDSAGEYCFTALRLPAGIDRNDFRRRYGKDVLDYFGISEAGTREHDEYAGYIKEGKIKEDAGSISLTESGIDISNGIMTLFI